MPPFKHSSMTSFFPFFANEQHTLQLNLAHELVWVVSVGVIDLKLCKCRCQCASVFFDQMCLTVNFESGLLHACATANRCETRTGKNWQCSCMMTVCLPPPVSVCQELTNADWKIWIHGAFCLLMFYGNAHTQL